MKRSSVVKSGIVLGAASLALAACGGSSSSESSASASAAPAKFNLADTVISDVPLPPAAANAPGAPATAAAGDGQLKIGTLLPQTGSLAFLGPPEFAAAELAVQQINAAGGVNGSPVELINGDSGDTSTNVASQTVDRLISQGVDAIVGAASSSVTLSVIDKVTGANVVMVSPANTSIKLSDYPDNGLYYRTAPPDTLQGKVLGDLALENGKTSMCILALQDAYGEGLANVVEETFTSGGGQVKEKIIYDPKAASFEAEVGQCKAANADSITMIGFDESKKILQELIKQGIGPQNTQLYLVDGNLSNTLADDLPAGTLDGVRGTTPGAAPSDTFRQQLLTVNSGLVDFTYAAEAYDAVNLIALAALQAKNDSGTAIAQNIVSVSGGNNAGEDCTDFAGCKTLLEQGKAINYEGQSGPINLAPNGDPQKAAMGVYVFGPATTS